MSDKFINVKISSDEMTAFFQLTEPGEQEEYKRIEVENAIKSQNVIYGINHEVVSSVVEEGKYNAAVEIAKGQPKIDGEDGYYEYLFNTELNPKPQINEDGTVNYRNLHLVEMVQKGQVIVVVHPPKPGIDGITVTGKKLLARKGREVPPLRGRGFEKVPDAQQYMASITGKVEKVNEKVFVTEIYEINGDVDMRTGNIDFRGDVIVHGNVTAGMSINATGTVTVDGTVEAAIVKAGKDIIIRGGFIGGYKGLIETEHNLFAKFMEYGTIRVGREIHTDSILNCHVTCYDKLYMEGKRANIIGGYVYAACGIDVYSLGSANGAENKIVVGLEKMHLQQLIDLNNEVLKNKELVKKIDSTLAQFDKLTSLQGKDPSMEEKKATILRTKIKTQSDIKIAQAEIEKLEDLKMRASDARIKAIRDVYQGVSITIGTEYLLLRDPVKTVEFKIHGGKLGIYSLV